LKQKCYLVPFSLYSTDRKKGKASTWKRNKRIMRKYKQDFIEDNEALLHVCTSTQIHQCLVVIVISCLKTTPDQPQAFALPYIYRVVLAIMPSKVVLIETAIAIDR